MCGIAGFVGFRDEVALKKMMQLLIHRGPDDDGLYCSENVSLGHRRLSIIDISEYGRQPMENEDGSIKLIFNGEIYNFKELRDELSKKGHVFRSQTDTEVILHQYEEDGTKCVELFNGMFAFALWDDKVKRLFLARDRLGIKPLYYYWDGSVFIFASEIKSLLQCNRVKKKLNLHATYEMLMLRYCRNPQTVIENLYKLSPGHYLTLERGGPPKVERYWRLSNERIDCDKEEAQQHFKELLRDSVKKRLVSDVPVGVMLSGGIDSAAITAFASMERDSLHTLSIGFEAQQDNEHSYAKLVADRFHTRHQEITVSPGHLNLLPQVVWHNDEPVAGPSSMAYYIALEEIKKNATVILFGHGADEILAGYEEIKIQKLTRLLFHYSLLRNACVSITGGISKRFPDDAALRRLSGYASSLNNPPENFFKLISVMDNRELAAFLMNGTPHLSEATEGLMRSLSETFKNAHSPLEGIMQFEIEGWLSEDILLRVDRITMARSIEGRVPFLDHRIVEFLSSLPLDWKLNRMEDKHLLRNSMRNILPKAICRRNKQRFNTPIHKFFSNDFDRLCRRIFSEENELNETVFRRDALLKLLDYKNTPSYRYILRHNKLTAQFYARQIWNILVFHLWYKMFFENQSAEEII